MENFSDDHIRAEIKALLKLGLIDLVKESSEPGGEVGGRDSSIKITHVFVVPLIVLKSKMTTVRIIAYLYFIALGRKKYDGI